MIPVIVDWTKDWSTAPFLDPDDCPHPGTSAIAIGVELVRARPGGSARVESRATLCMLCGTDTSGDLTPEGAIEAVWREYGWHASTRERLLALAERNRSSSHDEGGGA